MKKREISEKVTRKKSGAAALLVGDGRPARRPKMGTD
jgi:hypothetical protein